MRPRSLVHPGARGGWLLDAGVRVGAVKRRAHQIGREKDPRRAVGFRTNVYRVPLRARRREAVIDFTGG